MLTGIIGQCAAALCATMSPSQATTIEDPTPVESTIDVDAEANEEDPPSSTTIDATPEPVTVTVAEEEVSIELLETPEIVPTPVVMVSSPVVQPLDVQIELNAVSTTPVSAVPSVPTADEREIECLALNIYHEARGEPSRGRYAVAWVTVNRMRAAQFPDTVCEVVYQSARNPRTGRRVAQFSWIFQDPAPPQGSAWTDAQRIAREVYAQRDSRSGTYRLNSGVMYYHATSGVSRQNLNWFQRALRQVVRIGDHIFYTER